MITKDEKVKKRKSNDNGIPCCIAVKLAKLAKSEPPPAYAGGFTLIRDFLKIPFNALHPPAYAGGLIARINAKKCKKSGTNFTKGTLILQTSKIRVLGKFLNCNLRSMQNCFCFVAAFLMF